MTNWNCIKNRKIIDLFIGDAYLQNNPSLEYLKMPYMKGYQICDFAKSLGLNIVYNEEKLSRWQIMDKVIDYVVENNKISDFFGRLISIEYPLFLYFIFLIFLSLINDIDFSDQFSIFHIR